jgi:hypothetical protein
VLLLLLLFAVVAIVHLSCLLCLSQGLDALARRLLGRLCFGIGARQSETVTVGARLVVRTLHTPNVTGITRGLQDPATGAALYLVRRHAALQA